MTISLLLLPLAAAAGPERDSCSAGGEEHLALLQVQQEALIAGHEQLAHRLENHERARAGGNPRKQRGSRTEVSLEAKPSAEDALAQQSANGKGKGKASKPGKGKGKAAKPAAEGEGGEPATEGEDPMETEDESFEDPASDISITEAVMLLGTVGFFVALFYLVNHYNKQVVLSTWQMMSTTVSIFCAVLIFGALKELIAVGLGEEESDGTVRALVRPAGLVLTFLVALEVLLFTFKRSEASLIATGTLFAHVCGFAAIDFFGAVQNLAVFRGSVVLSAGTVLLAVLAILATFWGCAEMRDALICSGVSSGRASEEARWEDQCGECERDVAGLCLGLISSRVIRFAILGHLVPIYGAPQGMTSLQCCLLWASAACLAVVVLVVSRRWCGVQVDRVLTVVSMTMGWCLLYAGQWSYWNLTGGQGLAGMQGKMTARVVMALVDSVLAISAIFVVDSMAYRSPRAERGLKLIMKAMGLLLGLAWEYSFEQAGEDITEKFTEPGSRERLLLKVAMAMVLCIVVLPAWKLYILPNSLPEDERPQGPASKMSDEDVTDAEVTDARRRPLAPRLW